MEYLIFYYFYHCQLTLKESNAIQCIHSVRHVSRGGDSIEAQYITLFFWLCVCTLHTGFFTRIPKFLLSRIFLTFFDFEPNVTRFHKFLNFMRKIALKTI